MKHITYVELNQESVRRGGTSRTAICLCGWVGPERGTIELAGDDAFQHERRQAPTVTHVCHVCHKDYPCLACPDQGWACSTVNDDEDGNTCEPCLFEIAEELQRWQESQPA